MSSAQIMGSGIPVSFTVLYGWQNYPRNKTILFCYPEYLGELPGQAPILAEDKWRKWDSCESYLVNCLSIGCIDICILKSQAMTMSMSINYIYLIEYISFINSAVYFKLEATISKLKLSLIPSQLNWHRSDSTEEKATF